MKFYLLFMFLFIQLPSAFSQTTASQADKILLQYFQNQEYAKAATYLRLNHFKDNNDIQYLSLLGYANYMSNRLSDAAQCFNKILNIDTTNNRAVYYLGKINIAKGDLVKARDYFCKLVTYRPGVANYYKQLAALYQKLNNDAASGWYYKKAYRLNPDDAVVAAHFASSLLMQDLYLQADSILDRALKKDSLQSTMLRLRIRSAYQQKDFETIFPLIARLKSMGAISLQPFLFAAISYFQLEQYDSCIATCQLLAQSKLNSKTTMYLQALSYKALKQYDTALIFLNNCIAMSLDKSANGYFSAKGEILNLMHQPSNALKQYDTAYYIFHQPEQLYNKAKIYDIQFKNYKAALRFYKRYLKNAGKPKSGNEEKIYAFVKERAEQLERWEKERQ